MLSMSVMIKPDSGSYKGLKISVIVHKLIKRGYRYGKTCW